MNTVDLRYAETKLGPVVIPQDTDRYLSLCCKRLDALQYIRNRPELFAVRERSTIALMTHERLTEFQRRRGRPQLYIVPQAE